MKFYSVLILLVLITYIINEKSCNEIEPSGKNDCHGKLSESDKTNSKLSYCCYLEYDSKKGCYGATQKEYDNIKDTKKALEKLGNTKIDKIDCYSLFLKLGFLNLLFFLL